MHTIKPPIATKKPKQLTAHNDTRIDDYFWMNDRENPEVITHLEAENTYCDKVLEHTKAAQERLFNEIKARIKEDEESVPYKYNGYWYIVKFEKGQDYPIYYRKKETLDAEAELLFNCNEMAKAHKFFSLVGISISPNNKKVAYGIDTSGRREYTLHIKDIETNVVEKTTIKNTTGSSSWANDNETLFYTLKDTKTLRAYQVYKYNINTCKSTLIFEEADDTFGVSVYKSKSKAYIIISCYSTLTNQYFILNANTPNADFKPFSPRVRGLEYSIAHYNNHFYILTNKDKAHNFKLMKAPNNATEVEHWETVIPHREHTLIEGVDIFKNYLVLSERTNGLNHIRIKRWDNTDDYYLPFKNETYTCAPTTNVDFDTDILRYGYNSLATPTSVIAYNMATKTQKILKQQAVLDATFSPDNYVEERIWATAKDGTKIPMSVIYKKGLQLDGTNPLVQYAYGSYGATIDPNFSTLRLSLLNRGFIHVICHVRGSEYLGRHWYETGKLLHKKNTFTDFIDCSIHLIKQKYTSSNHLYAMGGSAGGLLMGVILNEAPELYNGVFAAVPFVDVITTMLDDTIPLTTGEYDEWGNPNDVLYYNYMKSYSPYDNVTTKSYPNIFVTSGLHDSQVQYWEPTKWVAKLRQYNTSNNPILLRTNMKAGHGGASGRFEGLKEDAEEYAFLLDLENITV